MPLNPSRLLQNHIPRVKETKIFENMDESLVRPDISLLKKNALALYPHLASKNKLLPNPFSAKKKSKLVKTKMCRILPEPEDTYQTTYHACRQGQDESNVNKQCNANHNSNHASSINCEDQNYEYLFNLIFATKDDARKNYEEARNKKQNLLSESFPSYPVATKAKEKIRKQSLPRSSTSLTPRTETNNVRIKSKEESMLQKCEEIEDELSQGEDEEIVTREIKRKSSTSLKSKPNDDTDNTEGEEIKDNLIEHKKIEDNIIKHKRIEDNLIEHKKIEDNIIKDKEIEELVLKKSTENVTQCLRDEIQIITNNIERKSSVNSIVELNRCMSDDISHKLNASVVEEEPKPTTDNKCEIMYSWQDLENWVPPSQKKKIAESNKNPKNLKPSVSACKIKYSWQVIGTGAQTSHHLIEDFLFNEEIRQKEEIRAKHYPCAVKYSWQIIGTATQVSFSNYDLLESDKEYWKGNILTPGKRVADDNNGLKNGEHKILYSEGTQTFAEKSHQTDMTDCRVKYSWQNLTKLYLTTDKLP